MANLENLRYVRDSYGDLQEDTEKAEQMLRDEIFRLEKLEADDS